MVRVKRRYILLKSVGDQGKVKFSASEFKNAVREYIAKTYGDFGVGCMNRGFTIKKYDTNDGYIIIQLRKGVHEMVMSVLPLVTQVNGQPCHLNMLHLSGTIRGSFKKLRLHYIVGIRALIGQQLAAKASTIKQSN